MTTRPHDQLVTLDDMDAISGTTHREIVGPYGSGCPNDNSDHLLSLCGMHSLTILGTWFRTECSQMDLDLQRCYYQEGD